MNRDEFKAITKDQQGAKIRSFLNAAASPHAPTSRSAIEADLDAAGITDETHRAELTATYVELAEKARGGANTFELRQAADQLTVRHVRAIKASDDLFGNDGIAKDATDDGSAEKTVRRVAARARGLNDEMFEQEEADNAERARLERLGIKAG